MEKYNKELIINYISGNDLDDYDINELSAWITPHH